MSVEKIRHVYKPMEAAEHGTTISCESLAREVNAIGNNNLRRKVSRHLNLYFARVLKFTSIPDPVIRYEVGKLLIKELDYVGVDPDVQLPEVVGFIVRNVKLAYIKDRLMTDTPLNYKRLP
jgi:hypothetical protein